MRHLAGRKETSDFKRNCFSHRFTGVHGSSFGFINALNSYSLTRIHTFVTKLHCITVFVVPQIL